jgi:uncharacterized protein YndB with AHSA1/START domain
MNEAALDLARQDINVSEVFPHSPETIWRALTNGGLIARWLMAPQGFEPIVGNRFTFQTTAAGPWDGIIHCEVLEVRPNQCFAFSWEGGHEENVGYGSRLDTLVTFTLSPTDEGTRLSLVHSGFVLPRNESAFTKMSAGWQTVLQRIDAISGEDKAAAMETSHG